MVCILVSDSLLLKFELCYCLKSALILSFEGAIGSNLDLDMVMFETDLSAAF